MKILHTSDWHIGRALKEKRRYGEMAQFLKWLEEVIRQREVDALLVAGDVFDNATPSNQAQELYYRFLQRMVRSPCRHVVITAGNHDSPTFLDAPSGLLGLLDIHVVGRAADEVLVLRDGEGRQELVVCAVPYLHDRDVRTVEEGDDFRDRQQALINGITRHYAGVMERAREVRQEGVPIVVMGHLFVRGMVEGDGVRELYVGALVQLGAGIFPPDADYVALGHLHVPQAVSERIRYSGSPIPMGFGEAGQQKSVCLVDLEAGSVETIPVPVFQRLERVHGGWDAIESRLAELRFAGEPAWLEVSYEGEALIGNLSERIERCVEGSRLEVISMKDEVRLRRAVMGMTADTGLEELTPLDVFERLMEAQNVPEEEREGLRRTYREALGALEEEGAAL